MLKNLSLIALTLVIAFGGGAWLTLRSVSGTERFGGLQIGPWTAFPDTGTANADPYEKARIARNGSLPLGAAEGIRFYAERDSEGRGLEFGCDYVLSGANPVARLWTLYASSSEEIPLDAGKDLPFVLHSRELVRLGAQSPEIVVAPSARPGNWLAVKSAQRGSFHLVLSLYDTPVATNAGLVDMKFPEIKRVACNG
jgi:hypothetical protein